MGQWLENVSRLLLALGALHGVADESERGNLSRPLSGPFASGKIFIREAITQRLSTTKLLSEEQSRTVYL